MWRRFLESPLVLLCETFYLVGPRVGVETTFPDSGFVFGMFFTSQRIELISISFIILLQLCFLLSSFYFILWLHVRNGVDFINSYRCMKLFVYFIYSLVKVGHVTCRVFFYFHNFINLNLGISERYLGYEFSFRLFMIISSVSNFI